MFLNISRSNSSCSLDCSTLPNDGMVNGKINQAYEKAKKLCARLLQRRFIERKEMPKGVVQYW